MADIIAYFNKPGVVISLLNALVVLAFIVRDLFRQRDSTKILNRTFDLLDRSLKGLLENIERNISTLNQKIDLFLVTYHRSRSGR